MPVANGSRDRKPQALVLSVGFIASDDRTQEQFVVSMTSAFESLIEACRTAYPGIEFLPPEEEIPKTELMERDEV